MMNWTPPQNDLILVGTRLPAQQHRILKIHAAQTGVSIQSLISRAIGKVLEEDLGVARRSGKAEA